MWDAILLILIGNLFNAFGLIVVGIVLTWVRKDVRKIEIATNSMKDALVLKAETEGLAVGEAIGRKAERAKQARDAR